MEWGKQLAIEISKSDYCQAEVFCFVFSLYLPCSGYNLINK